MSTPVNAHQPHFPLSVAEAERQMIDLRAELAASVEDEHKRKIESCVAILAAMLPAYRQFEKFLSVVRPAATSAPE